MTPKPLPDQGVTVARSVVYQRQNGYGQSVPGTLAYWLGYLTDPNDHANRNNPVVQLREVTTTVERGPWIDPLASDEKEPGRG